MEGDSVTLYTNLTELHRYDHILWMFGPQETRIAELYKRSIDMLDGKLFGERTLWLDSRTGSLTITNISTSHTGLYKQIIRNRETYNAPHHMQFKVTVYARQPKDSLTEHLDIIEHCESCTDHLSKAISAGVILLVLIVHAAGLILLYRRCKHKSKKAVQREEPHYMNTGFLRQSEEMKASGTEGTISSSVK
ncbi:hypothetical protein E1301_Tti023345 [Triplophysa tibetana]|uniref:Immunoglobulin V-set domain-containing protein n=1 Tax=Triplophysa tibetana TaxID=1572043 RepID=A0A5A9NRD8_9TELE|nr:hypothetical protein E1301_Tti023345 [Triplophysa tibetana]